MHVFARMLFFGRMHRLIAATLTLELTTQRISHAPRPPLSSLVNPPARARDALGVIFYRALSAEFRT